MHENNGTILFFDAGDTLIYARRTLHEAVCAVCRRRGLLVDEAYVRTCAAAIKPQLGPVTTLDPEAFREWWWRMYAQLLACCGYPGDIRAAQEELWRLWRSGSALRLFPDTLESLRELRSQGYRMAVVSNWDDTLPGTLTRLGIRDYFEEIFCSYLVGAEKPDPGLFQHAMQVMNVEPSVVWHIGDSPESDVAGAMSAGIRPILVDYFGKFDGERMDVPVVRSLGGVRSVLGS